MRSILAALAAIIAAAPALADQVCGASDEIAVARLSGEVYGAHGAEHRLSDKLTFALAPQAYGWGIVIRDVAGDDLAQLNPPLHVVDTNARTIAGWHFRTADNTGPNRGEVNAPQTFRTVLFGFETLDPALNPELAAPGSPIGDPGSAAVADVAPAAPLVRPPYGRVELQIEDYGLADLEPGERARMVYLKYSACVEWTPLDDETYEEGQGPAFPKPVRDRLDACGFSGGYQLVNAYGFGRTGAGASWLALDVDADGQEDLAAPIERTSDLKRGIALCRGDGTLELLGLEGGYGEHLVAAYFDHADWWGVAAPGARETHPLTGEPGPTLAGEGITLGKEGASSALLYWDGAAWTSFWQGD